MNAKLFCCYLLIILFLHTGFAQPFQWQKIDTGLHYATIPSPIPSSIGDSKISVLRINPEHYHFTLASQKEGQGDYKTAKEWSAKQGFSAVINAGMFQNDNLTNVGYMKDSGFVNNGTLNHNNTIAAFNRKDTSLPRFQIIDLKCQNWDNLKDEYYSYTQSIRMINCNQQNMWRQQNQKFSMVVLGADKQGNALFIFSRSPYSGHDMNDILLQLPLNIHNVMYLEGGPETTFYLNHKGTEVSRVGSYETDYREDNRNDRLRVLPNVIGIRER